MIHTETNVTYYYLDILFLNIVISWHLMIIISTVGYQTHNTFFTFSYQREKQAFQV